MRLTGPMQSWGTQSRFLDRETGREPSKSGVIGLVCAALGKRQLEQTDDRARLSELADLVMGVRVDHEGDLLMDYQTAGGSPATSQYGVAKADGSRPGPIVSRRYYLADADFLVGLAGDDTVLRVIDEALLAPCWPLFLGRKAFTPGVPVRLPDAGPDSSWWDMTLEAALRTYPTRHIGTRQAPRQFRLVLEEPTGLGPEVRQDVPIDFATRRFDLRHVRTEFIPNPLLESDRVPVTAAAESSRS